MSMQDPIADMLTRIRNGQAANKVAHAPLLPLMPAAHCPWLCHARIFQSCRYH